MTGTSDAVVEAVSCSATHTMTKPNQESIRLLPGLGVEGDAHLGETVKHRSRVARDPSQPNLRQVHLIHAELHEELRAAGFMVSAGQMGENVTTRGLDVLALPTGTRLHLGASAVVEVTGLRNPCGQLDGLQPGLIAATLDRDADGNLIRKAGIMGTVLAGGEIRPGDPIRVELPPEPHRPLEPVQSRTMAAIYLVRHGESETNVRNILSHRQADLPLTERGQQQAEQVARRLAALRPARVYASPLLRARQTADRIAAHTGAPVVLVEALREINCGILDGRGDEEAWATIFAMDRRWEQGEWDTPHVDGESYRQVRTRLDAFLSRLMREHPSEDVVAVGHGGLFWFGVPSLCALPTETAAELRNTAVTILRHHEGALTCELWGCVEHLNGA